MSSKLLHPDMGSNESGEITLHFKVTAAADVEADGYTISDGSEIVSSFARTDEGDITITLHNNYKKFFNLIMLTTLANQDLIFVSEDVDGDKTILITIGVSGTPTDPDSAVMYFTLKVGAYSSPS
jgi:hypothetical protein